MFDTLCVELAETEGALMRLIGLVERRGFVITTFEKGEARDGFATVTMRLRARDAARTPDILSRQISRLLDVRAVFTPEIAAAAQVAHAPHQWSQACPPRN